MAVEHSSHTAYYPVSLHAKTQGSLPDEAFRLAAEMHVVWEKEMILPVDDLAIHVVRVL